VPAWRSFLEVLPHSPGLLLSLLTHSLGFVGHPFGFLHDKLLATDARALMTHPSESTPTSKNVSVDFFGGTDKNRP
jgi:hypothetical protein